MRSNRSLNIKGKNFYQMLIKTLLVSLKCTEVTKKVLSRNFEMINGDVPDSLKSLQQFFGFLGNVL